MPDIEFIRTNFRTLDEIENNVKCFTNHSWCNHFTAQINTVSRVMAHSIGMSTVLLQLSSMRRSVESRFARKQLEFACTLVLAMNEQYQLSKHAGRRPLF